MSDKKVAVVTGASAGIGEAIAEKLLQRGWRVYVAARRVDRLQKLAGIGAIAIGVDVTDDDSMLALVNRVIETEGRIDALVNNAGYGAYGAVEDVPMDDARRQFEVNVFGLARLTQLVLPHMRAQRSGRVINISSVGGKVYMPMGGWYHATKHAVEALSDALRLEAKPFGIDVVIIEPGAVQSEWLDISTDSLMETSGQTAYGPMAKALKRGFKNAYSDRYAAKPDDIANVVLEALTVKRPRARYAAPFHAKMGILLRRLLPDSVFDKMLVAQFRLPTRAS